MKANPTPAEKKKNITGKHIYEEKKTKKEMEEKQNTENI